MVHWALQQKHAKLLLCLLFAADGLLFVLQQCLCVRRAVGNSFAGCSYPQFISISVYPNHARATASRDWGSVRGKLMCP